VGVAIGLGAEGKRKEPWKYRVKEGLGEDAEEEVD